MSTDAALSNARVLVWRPDGRVAVVRNGAGERAWWSLPGGRLEPGETLGEAAVREAREEPGLDVRLVGVAVLLEHVGPDGHFPNARSEAYAFQGESFSALTECRVLVGYRGVAGRGIPYGATRSTTSSTT